MTSRPARPDAGDARQLDAVAIGGHLSRLTADYPEFRFSHQGVGRKSPRWVAERRDGDASGLRAVITDDLMELLAALARDRERRAQ